MTGRFEWSEDLVAPTMTVQIRIELLSDDP